MDVAVSALRAHLSEWLERVRSGEEVVITDRGVPVGRLVAIGSTTVMERLLQEGAISKPTAAGRPKARTRVRVRAEGPVADLVAEQRR